tara:strand:- start:131 stop:475 length:345 start_codon:yes stop_codon:yes gene_type:complete
LFCFTCPSQNSPFEGIYILFVPDQSAYATVQVKGNEAIIMLLFEDDWEPYIGTTVGDELTAAGVTSIVGVDIKISASFSTPSILNITIDSCNSVTDEFVCTFPSGYTLQAMKAW